jgi:predicted short-subunit dehydrogenase-like oxidoreductase (DUF2520 family)
MIPFTKLLIAGTGKLAESLAVKLGQQRHLNVLIWGRNPEAVQRICSLSNAEAATNSLHNPLPVLLCVSDSAIRQVALELSPFATCFVHFSGSLSLEILPSIEGGKALCWPIQTFGKPNEINWSAVPLCTESAGEEAALFLAWICKLLEGPRIELPEEKRRALHLAAIVANNFTNHLMHLSKTYCDRNQIPFEYLMPLLRQTVSQLGDNDPHNLQTGPARRHDRETIEKHLVMLQNDPELSEIYLKFSSQISQLYNPEK